MIKKILLESFAQIRNAKFFLILLYLPVVVLFLVSFYIMQKEGIPFKALSGDLLVMFKVPTYIGMLSEIGMLLWSAAATLALFSMIVIARDRASKEFLGYFSILTLFLLADDLFLLHDRILVSFQYYFYGAYALLAIVFLIRYFKFISKTDFYLLLAAFGFFAISIFVDVFFAEGHVIEDGAKLLGITSWLGYCILVCRGLLEKKDGLK